MMEGVGGQTGVFVWAREDVEEPRVGLKGLTDITEALLDLPGSFFSYVV